MTELNVATRRSCLVSTTWKTARVHEAFDHHGRAGVPPAGFRQGGHACPRHCAGSHGDHLDTAVDQLTFGLGWRRMTGSSRGLAQISGIVLMGHGLVWMFR